MGANPSPVVVRGSGPAALGKAAASEPPQHPFSAEAVRQSRTRHRSIGALA